MRLPNPFGSVYKLSGKRRHPYIARKTAGWDENGKQKYFTVGYYKTRAEGLHALASLQFFRFDLLGTDVRKLTFKDLYSYWSMEKFKSISQSNVRGYKAAFAHAAALHEMRFLDIRPVHMQVVLDSCQKGYQTKKKLHILFSQLYKYAIAHEACGQNHAAGLDLGCDPGGREKLPFTEKEIAALLPMAGSPAADSVLILCYTGFRISELLELKTADVDLEARTLRGGMKTTAGKNRLVPIHRCILPLIRRYCQCGQTYLLCGEKGEKLDYYAYRRRYWDPLMEKLGFSHTPHETRHTFITRASNAGADTVCIKRIVGHACRDLTERVYTHKDLAQLRRAIDCIP